MKCSSNCTCQICLSKIVKVDDSQHECEAHNETRQSKHAQGVWKNLNRRFFRRVMFKKKTLLWHGLVYKPMLANCMGHCYLGSMPM